MTGKEWRQRQLVQYSVVSAPTQLLDYIDANKVKEAFNSFGPQKAAGPDGLRPATFQCHSNILYHTISHLYKKSIEVGYTPQV